MSASRYIYTSIIVAVLMVAGPLRAHDHQHNATKLDAALQGTSLYHISDKWTADDGHSVTLSDFDEQPVVLTMAYTSCKDICPLIIADMMHIEDEALKQGASKMQFLFVSLDPEHDTPAQLSAYAAKHGLDHSRWTLLQGTPKSVRLLAAAIGLRYRRVDATTIDHSTLLTLIDASGRIVMQSGNDPADHEKLIERLVALSKQQP